MPFSKRSAGPFLARFRSIHRPPDSQSFYEPQMKKNRCLWCVSTRNHNILYFVCVPRYPFPKHGESPCGKRESPRQARIPGTGIALEMGRNPRPAQPLRLPPLRQLQGYAHPPPGTSSEPGGNAGRRCAHVDKPDPDSRFGGPFQFELLPGAPSIARLHRAMGGMSHCSHRTAELKAGG